MAFKNLIAFGAGEITPELYERGNLDKFRTGLKTLRNATVTKMGGLLSRAGTLKLNTTKLGAKAKFVYIADRNYLLEFTNSNIRVYSGFNPDTNTFVATADISLVLYPTADTIEGMQFTFGNRYLFMFREGYEVLRFDLDKVFTSPASSVDYLRNYVAPTYVLNASISVVFAAGVTVPTGYAIKYGVTSVNNGIETFVRFENSTLLKPINTGQYNIISITVDKTFYLPDSPIPDEFRIYQKPSSGNAYLYVGKATKITETASVASYEFKDYGVELDVTNLPPEYVSEFRDDTEVSTGPTTYTYPPLSKTGLVYQDRLVFSGSRIKNRVFASRTGSTAMTRDFPLQDDSAVSFKIGSSGALKVNRFFDGRGLMIFTTVGVYETPSNLLTPETAYAIKRGPYVAEEAVEPIQLGGYVTIYDKRLKSVIGLTPSGNYDGYAYNEFSIYSAHLLKGKKIVSWALQEAETSILWIVLNDGSVLAFSYQEEQLLRSWSRHDFKDGLAEEVFVMKMTDGLDVVCFSINRGGTRYIERLTPRDAELMNYVGTDSTVIFKNSMINGTMTVTPVVPNDWDGILTLTSSGATFNGAIVGLGAVGSVFRIFLDDGSAIDLTVTTYVSNTVVRVQPNIEFPSSMANLTQLWQTFSTLTGLSHLNGKKVAVRVDGFTHASPLNTDKAFNEYTVTGGSITLADDTRGAFISVGLPIVTDIETLEVDTVEQSPTKLEGKIVNKLWLSYFESMFLYAGATLPADDTVTGMDIFEFQTEEDVDLGIGSTIPPQPQSYRLEMNIAGDWKVNGSVALRNVDPQPIGIRAIIPDTEVIRN